MRTSTAHPLWEQFSRDLAEAPDTDAVAAVRDKYLSRHRGLLSLEMRQLGKLPASERPAAGKLLNELRGRVEAALEERLQQLRGGEREQLLREEAVDVTLPAYRPPPGGLHPLGRLRREIEEIFVAMGFRIEDGPEIESDYYNFEALNIPAGHPARESQDTFYVDDSLLLRSHTSPVQIRTMENQQPPVRIVVPGRVYRRDAVDATHSPMFHQFEVLVVDEGIRFSDLKGTLEVFLQALFSKQTRIRLRPSYFPFVEPGAEVDISCFCLGKGCRTCKQTGWIEILGAGMVHPRVLEMVGYDSSRYTGFAWGMGVERMAQLKYEIPDVRLFFENDVRFLRQF